MHNAVTINAGTGAELAAAVRNLLITQKMPLSKETPEEVVNKTELLNEEEMDAQANFFAQRFTTEWRICLKRASSDFDRAMQLFWSEVRELLFVCVCVCVNLYTVVCVCVCVPVILGGFVDKKMRKGEERGCANY